MVDNAHGRETCLRAATTLGTALVAQEIVFGFAPQHRSFPGSISLRTETLESLIVDVGESLLFNGFALVYFWVAHAESHTALVNALGRGKRGMDGLRNLAGYLSATWAIMGPEEGVSLEIAGSHAGEIEASMMRAIDDDHVDMQRASEGNLHPFDSLVDRMMAGGMESVSPSGVLGDQRHGDVARGHRYLDRLAKWCASDVQRAQKDFDK